MITLGLLGEVAIDFTEGTEASGRANSGEIFAGERVPDFGEAIARMLDIIAPVATEATATFKQLELTAENLSHITDENSELNLALTQFKTFGEHLNQLTGPEGALSISLTNLKQLTGDLTKNDNIAVTLQNFRTSSEKLKSTLTSLGPSLQASGENVKEATATLKSEPWRLIWPSTKKYPENAHTGCPAGLVTPAPGAAGTLHDKLDRFATFRGQLGIAVTIIVLLYSTGGAAWGEVEPSLILEAVTATGVPFPAVAST